MIFVIKFVKVLSDSKSEKMKDENINSEHLIRKIKSYDEKLLNGAINDVKNQNCTVFSAAKKYNIPKTTLSWRLNKIEKGENLKKSGPDNVLTAEEENDLAEWLISCAELGYPKTKPDIIHAASEIRKRRMGSLKSSRQSISTPQFKNEVPSNFWVKSFLKRHPNVCFRTPEPLSRAAANVSEGKIRHYFQHIHNFFEKEGLLHLFNRRDAIYNLDETNFELNPQIKKVLAGKGSKNVFSVDSSKPKQNITVTYCFGADGKVLRSQIILKTSFSKLEDVAYASGSVNGQFLFTQTDSGWQTKDSFAAYLKKLDDELKDVERPIIFFFDNHPSHINFELFKWCKTRQIHCITFPPHTTHILQMCDTSIFGPAKQGWKKEIIEWKRSNGNKEVDEIEFVKILKNVNDKVLTSDKIINGFKGTGIFPFNINNVHLERCIGANIPLDDIQRCEIDPEIVQHHEENDPSGNI